MAQTGRPVVTRLADFAVYGLRCLPPEVAHRLAVRALRHGWGPRADDDDPALAVNLWGLRFPNPIGMAAGFDKNAEAADGLLRAGFGFVEVGTVTPRPQTGNPRPRLFRLPADQALINRLGFNNDGAEAVAARLARRPRQGVLGVNIGANRDSADRAADYATGFTALARFADYVVINVSSPNTPGLRGLQAKDQLETLISALLAMRGDRQPLLVKIAPDLDDQARADIAAVALDHHIDGLIIANTTAARPPGLRSSARDQDGGLSGRPLLAPSTALLADMRRRTGGQIPLIGVGGIASAADAYAKIRAGASLVQLYTALIYQGLGLVAAIKRGLATRLRADGFGTIGAAVGADVPLPQDHRAGH